MIIFTSKFSKACSFTQQIPTSCVFSIYCLVFEYEPTSKESHALSFPRLIKKAWLIHGGAQIFVCSWMVHKKKGFHITFLATTSEVKLIFDHILRSKTFFQSHSLTKHSTFLLQINYLHLQHVKLVKIVQFFSIWLGFSIRFLKRF